MGWVMSTHKIGMYTIIGTECNRGIGINPVWFNFLVLDNTMPAVIERLKEWNGKINVKDMSIEFASEKDLTMFLLRWGV